MKQWLASAVALLMAATVLTSCKKDEVKATVTPSNDVTLSSSTNAVVLTQASGTQAAITYTWTPIASFASSGSDSTLNPSVNYQLQVSRTENGFGFPAAKIDAGTGSSKFLASDAFNTALISAGLAPTVTDTVYVRLVAVVGTDDHTFRSNVLPLVVTPYKACVAPNTDVWGLVGPAGDGWPGATATDRIMTYNCDDQAYEIRTTLNAGEFKFRRNRDWGTNLGGSGTTFSTGVTLTTNGPNLTATAGTVTVKLKVMGAGATTAGGAISGGTVTIVP